MGLLRKLGALVARRRYEAELDEELRYHVEREAERNRAGGMDPVAARVAARRSLGNVTLARESIRSTWGWPRLGELRQDLVFAFRSFRREPALVATVVLTIGLGVGLNTAFFTIFNAYVLRPFPVADPSSLYQVRWHTRDQAGYGFSWQQYLDLSQQPVVREQLGYRYLVTRIDGQSTRVMMTTGNYFGMLGVGAALGRVLGPADTEGGGTSTGVLSHDTWRQRFGADPGIIGRTVLVRGQPVEIVGVARAGFDGIDDNSPDLWVPITMVARLENHLAPFGVGDGDLVQVILRFRPGIATEAARVALSDWLVRDTGPRPEPDRVIAAQLVSKATAQPLTPSVLLTVAPIFLAFGLVLLAACANVASAMIARGIARRDEIGVRLALGAGRARVVRQLLTESILLAVPAALAGLAISRMVLAGVTWFIAATVPEAFKSFVELAPVDPDYRVLLFAIGSAVLCAVGFGLIPALQATRPNTVRSPVGMVSSGARPSRLRQGLLVAQIAIATLLLIVTGILLGGTQRIPARDMGIDPSGVVVIDLDDRFRAAALARLRDDPSVRAIAATDRVPLESAFRRVGLTGPDRAIVNAGAAEVSGGFFEALSHRVLAGRTFLDDESRNGAPVVIVNESAARALWGTGNVLDRTLRIVGPGGDGGAADQPELRVIGVVRDAVTGWIGDPPGQAAIYRPLDLERSGRLLIRVDGPGSRAALAWEQTLTAIDQAAPAWVHPLEDSVAVSLWPLRAAYWVGAMIGLVALALTLSGVYGVLAFTVAVRTRELGVRAALGASRRNVVGLIVGESVTLGAVGVAVGAVVAVGIARFTAAHVEGVEVLEPLAYLGGAAAVLLACLAGAVLPSRRAARVEPLTALRAD